MIGLAAIIEAVLAGFGIDGHAADGVKDGRSGIDMMVVMAVAGVIVTSAAARAL
jgi:hypothetical protein